MGRRKSYQASGPSSLCSEVLAGGAVLLSALLAQPTAGRLDSSLRRLACLLSPALTPGDLQAFPAPMAPDPRPPKPNLKIPFFHFLPFQNGDAALETNTLAPRAYVVLSSQASPSCSCPANISKHYMGASDTGRPCTIQPPASASVLPQRALSSLHD